METHAVNLLDGQTALETWNPAQRTLLEDLHRVGNNGWASKSDAERLLPDLLAGGVSRDIILGFMVARGHGDKSVERLSATIDKLV